MSEQEWLAEAIRSGLLEWADEVVASGENGVLGEHDLSVQIVRTLADNPCALANVIDALLYIALSGVMPEDGDGLLAVSTMADALVAEQRGGESK